jgi:hypothetical protein
MCITLVLIVPSAACSASAIIAKLVQPMPQKFHHNRPNIQHQIGLKNTIPQKLSEQERRIGRGSISSCLRGKAVDLLSLREDGPALRLYLRIIHALTLRNYFPYYPAHVQEHYKPKEIPL